MTHRERLETCLCRLKKAELGSAAWMEQVWAVEALLSGEVTLDGSIDEARLELARDIVRASYECLGAHHQYGSVEYAERVSKENEARA